MTRSQHLRVWQRDALELYQRKQPRDFLTVATPGAGKTTFALTIAADLMSRGIVERVVIVRCADYALLTWSTQVLVRETMRVPEERTRMIENGRARLGMIVAEMLRRNTKMTITTRTTVRIHRQSRRFIVPSSFLSPSWGPPTVYDVRAACLGRKKMYGYTGSAP